MPPVPEVFLDFEPIDSSSQQGVVDLMRKSSHAFTSPVQESRSPVRGAFGDFAVRINVHKVPRAFAAAISAVGQYDPRGSEWLALNPEEDPDTLAAKAQKGQFVSAGRLPPKFTLRSKAPMASTNLTKELLKLGSGGQERSVGEAISSLPSTTASQSPKVAGRVKAILRILERWKIGRDDAARMLGASDPEFIALLEMGAGKLATRDAEDRARYVLEIFEGVCALFRDAGAERTWIRSARDDLGGKSVLELMTEGSLFNLLKARSFVEYVNGR